MNYLFSFFSGAGIWDHALEKKFQIIHTNEINKEFYKGYTQNNKKPSHGVINWNFSELLKNSELNYLIKKEISILKSTGYVGFVGGSPCTDFSIAGKNLGEKGINGNLFSEFIDLILDCEPDFFVIENVPNLIHKHYNYFKNQYIKIYQKYNCNFSMINAMEFAVPQNRNRIFIYGIHKKIKKLSLNINDFKKYHLSDLKKISWPKPQEISENIDIPENIIMDLTLHYWWEKNNVENHFNQKDFYIHSPHRDITLFEGQRRSQRICRYHRYKYANTLCFGSGRNIPGHPYKLRSITIAEALAIMSLPKTFILPDSMSLVNKYRVIANGVPYNMGYAITEMIHNELL